MIPSAYTLRDEQLLPWIITPCSLSVAFDPDYSSLSHPLFVEMKGLWDTGASCSVITKAAALRLGILPIRQVKTRHAQGESETNLYYINVLLPNKIEVKNLRVTEGVLDGFDMLLGMDIINLGDFALTHKNDGTVFSFQIPSTHEYDFVKQIQNGVGKKGPKRKG